MENILATQAFTNSEIISEPQTGIEPSCKSNQLPICELLDIYLKSLYFPKLILSACTLVFLKQLTTAINGGCEGDLYQLKS